MFLSPLGFDGLVQISRMRHQIGRGEIDDKNIVLSGIKPAQKFVCNFETTRFGLKIMQRIFRRLNENPLFARMLDLDSAVEKICDVRIFFRFGDAAV